jgi:hypothetical protein
MLYMPPSYNGAPTTYVPLHEFDWSVFGYATYDGVQWTSPVLGSGITTNDIGPTSVLPDWTELVLP